MKRLIALAVLVLPLSVNSAMAAGLSANTDSNVDANVYVKSQMQAQTRQVEVGPTKEPVVEVNSQNSAQAEAKGLNVEKLFRSFNTLNVDLPAITKNVQVKTRKTETQPRRPGE